jgi:hypothetical protein
VIHWLPGKWAEKLVEEHPVFALLWLVAFTILIVVILGFALLKCAPPPPEFPTYEVTMTESDGGR